MNNYEFCTQWILDRKADRPVRVLDYGCGTGTIVKLLRDRGVDAFGCDVFYEGKDYSADIEPAFFARCIRRMDGERRAVPFDDASFDYVISNQVFEHVEDLDAALAEIRRVLKPGGELLSLFPDKGVWREGHCGIPFLHWFPKGSGPRVYYATAFRILGYGYHKEDKTPVRWSRDFCEWLDKWTYYRSRRDIDAAFKKHFHGIESIEHLWLRQRFGRHPLVAVKLPAAAHRLIVRKLGGLVFIARAS